MESGRPATRRMSDRVQAIVLRAGFACLRRLGPVASSNLGGWITRTVGPHLRVTRVAEQNLRRAMPELDGAARARIIRAVWDNLGRNIAELPHLAGLRRTESGPGWEFEGEHHAEPFRRDGTPILYVSGHFGNWEMLLPIAVQWGTPAAGFYRAPSNREVDDVVQSLRAAAMGPGIPLFAKGASGARAALAHLKQGGSLGLLIDQKMNDGIAVPFFGRDAMTAPALAQFALRFGMPIVPARVMRLGPARFRMICDPPLAVAVTGDRTQDVHAITQAVNATLERWIRAEPGAWLWLHRRWPKDEAARRPAAIP